MSKHDIRRFDSKWNLLQELAKGQRVLHFGVTGETGRPLKTLVAQAPTGFHAALTAAAERCVGIDINAEAVKAIAEAGIFDNVLVADATTVRRDEIPLDRIDLIVAGDIIEHLSDPGALLDNATRLADPQTRLALTTPNAVGLASFLHYARVARFRATHTSSRSIATAWGIFSSAMVGPRTGGPPATSCRRRNATGSCSGSAVGSSAGGLTWPGHC